MKQELHGLSFAANSPEDCLVLMSGKRMLRVQSLELQLDETNAIPAKLAMTPYGADLDEGTTFTVDELKSKFKFVICYIDDGTDRRFYPHVFWKGELLSRVKSLTLLAAADGTLSVKISCDPTASSLFTEEPWIEVAGA